ncbi:MAG TPA: penicillin-binding protein 2, partial [Candidatus Berkiella sp.]|nr:penicillin-binding protein 2 [Candidatus Berkiella sp.]
MKLTSASEYRLRQWSLMLLGLAGIGLLLWRLVMLQIIDKHYLQSQGDARTIRTVPMMAKRGLITDRRGEPLAISTPVKSVWVVPTKANIEHPDWVKLAHLLEMNPAHITQKIVQKKDKQFVYLKRHISPMLGKKVEALNIPGVHLQTEYQRFYPTGEVSAHIIGTTDIDHNGAQGLELGFNELLAGESGHYRVLKDAVGQKVQSVAGEKQAVSGQDVVLSIDNRIQYLAYRELLAAVKKHDAIGGSVVVLDVKTGEVLAMANQPSFNPNRHYQVVDHRFRNRAVTDQFEPGSVLKSFSVANILASGKYDSYTEVDTNPGWMKVSGKVVRDGKNYGVLDLSHVIQKSSNVGIAKLTLELPPESLYETLRKVGFGQRTASGFPGESSGYLSAKVTNNPFVLATVSFGYGMSVTPLQLAQAYAVLADGGRKHPVSFIKIDASRVSEEQVFEPHIAQAVN